MIEINKFIKYNCTISKIILGFERSDPSEKMNSALRGRKVYDNPMHRHLPPYTWRTLYDVSGTAGLAGKKRYWEVACGNGWRGSLWGLQRPVTLTRGLPACQQKCEVQAGKRLLLSGLLDEQHAPGNNDYPGRCPISDDTNDILPLIVPYRSIRCFLPVFSGIR